MRVPLPCCIKVKVRNTSNAPRSFKVYALDRAGQLLGFGGAAVAALSETIVAIDLPHICAPNANDCALPEQIDVANINLHDEWSDNANFLELLSTKVSTAMPRPLPPWQLPFVDRFGQLATMEWPQKVHSAEELIADLSEESASLLPRPASWDEFGGYAIGPRHAATGAFRLARRGKGWSLVTPTGSEFFSWGINTLRHCTDSTFGRKRSNWFIREVPKIGWMSFAHWNLQEKFQEKDYLARYYEFINRRLDSWGVNTMGRWAARAMTASAKRPYVEILFGNALRKLPKLGNTELPDCFHPNFQSILENTAKEEIDKEKALQTAVNDPLCVMLIAGDNLLVPPLATGVAEAQTRTLWLETFFGVLADTLRKIAPNRLAFCGSFATDVPDMEVLEIAAKHFDGLCLNLHTYSVDGLANKCPPHIPVLIGAFSFGCIDRGMVSAGTCPVSSQDERAKAMETFIHSALRVPNVVGCHYFQYRDQPLLGRVDGECYGIGFVDGVDRPYMQMTATSRSIGERLYELRNT